MKHLFSTLKLLFTALLLQSNFVIAQTTIQVNNGDDLQTLINNAANGTIFMVGGGSYATTGLNISKPVTLIGTGYFLQTGSQANPTSATLGEVTFNAGASGAVLMGFMTSNISILTNNIQVSRNYTGQIKVGYGPYASSSVIVNNAVVKQNYMTYGVQLSNATNTTLQNNIILYEFTVTGSTNQICSATIKNNTVKISPNVSSSLAIGSNIRLENNIFHPTYLNTSIPSFAYFQYNIFTDYSWSVDNTNKVNQNANLLYQGFPTNTGSWVEDARYILASSSPAKNSGRPATTNYDCGAFGGSEPYVLSGLPPVPTVYELIVPTSVATGQTLNITVKARIGN